MQKVFTWLDEHKIPYQFHDYKASGIDKATLELWLKHLPKDKLINTKGTTFRGFTEAEKDSISRKSGAIKIMLTHNSVIKRPVWDLGNGTYLVGWDEELMNDFLLQGAL